MKTSSLKQNILAGLAFGGLALATQLHADTTVFFGGGNASQSILYDRVTNILTGGISKVIISPTNSTVRTYVGTIASQPGLGTASWRLRSTSETAWLADWERLTPNSATPSWNKRAASARCWEFTVLTPRSFRAT